MDDIIKTLEWFLRIDTDLFVIYEKWLEDKNQDLPTLYIEFLSHGTSIYQDCRKQLLAHARALQDAHDLKENTRLIDVSDIDVLETFLAPVRSEMPRETICSQSWGVTEEQVYRLWHRRVFQGLIDYGTSMRTGWLTEKGESVLVQLKAQNKKNTHELTTSEE